MGVSQRRGLWWVSCLAAPALAGMVALVLMQPERDFWPDHLCLTALFGAAAAWYLRDPRLIAVAAAIALVTCFLDLGPPVGPDPLAAMVEPPAAPLESTIQKPGGEQAWARWRIDQQLDAQRRLVVFVALNALGFLALLAVAWPMRRRALREAVARSSACRGVEPLPVLAIEEGVNGEYGARSRKRSRERRGMMGSYILALPLMAMIFGVVVFPMRSFEVDGIILVVVIAAAAVWYLREPTLAAAAVSFAVVTWCIDLTPPDRPPAPPSSSAARPAVAASPRDGEPQDRDDAQRHLRAFLILNSVCFGGLMARAAFIRKRRVASEAKEAHAASHRAPPRLRDRPVSALD